MRAPSRPVGDEPAAGRATGPFILVARRDRALRKRKGSPPARRKIAATAREPPMSDATQYALTFESLSGDGLAYAFPCDAQGRVDLDSLGERARNDYLFARGLVGRTFAAPAVHACDFD
jgi:hypothetical protein